MDLGKNKIFLFLIYCGFILIFNTYLHSQNKFDTIYVDLNVKRLGKLEIKVLMKEKDVYLPLISIFNFLRIKVEPSADLQVIKGNFISPDSAYKIDLKNLSAVLLKKEIKLNQDDFVISEKEIFFRQNIYSELFGLDLKFNERTLEVEVKNSHKFAVLEMKKRQRIFGKHITAYSAEPEQYLGRKATIFNFGRINYS